MTFLEKTDNLDWIQILETFPLFSPIPQTRIVECTTWQKNRQDVLFSQQKSWKQKQSMVAIFVKVSVPINQISVCCSVTS